MKIVYSKKKRFLDEAIEPTKHKQKNIRPTILFETEKFSFKKTGTGQISTQDLCSPGRFRYLQAECAGYTKKLQFNKNQCTSRVPDESCEQSYFEEKVKYPLL